jgi:4-hydroxy-2-oxoheptanedioate aldolase
MKISGKFRQRVLAREWVAGTFLNLGSPITVEIAGNSGLDWVLIDHEHGPGGEDTMLHQLQAVGCTPAVPIVRIAANEMPRFKRALDMGAQGIMAPYISTAAEARAAVAAMRYPPLGQRGVAKVHRAAGFGTDFEEYYRHAHEWLVTVAQIENAEGVNAADEIAAVDGVDVLFVGPTDLSYNLGIPDQFDHARYIEAQQRVVAAAKAHGKAAGILVQTAALVTKSRELGFTFVALGSDGSSVRSGLQSIAKTLREA